VLDELEAARGSLDETGPELVLDDPDQVAGRGGAGDPVTDPVQGPPPDRVDRDPAVAQLGQRQVDEPRQPPRLEVHADHPDHGGELDDEAPGPHPHEPAVGQHGRCAGGVGVVQPDGPAEVDEQVCLRHRRDVQPSVPRDPVHAVDVIDEPVERRRRCAAEVVHLRIVA
jgi:hypothetical protein